MVKSIGCEFGRSNRMHIETIQKNQDSIMTSLKEIQITNKEMFNHFTDKYEAMFKEAMTKTPSWITAVAGISGVIIGGLAIWALTH